MTQPPPSEDRYNVWGQDTWVSPAEEEYLVELGYPYDRCVDCGGWDVEFVDGLVCEMCAEIRDASAS